MGRSSWRPSAIGLRFLLEISGALSGVFLHRERRSFGRTGQQACGQTHGDGATNQSSQHTAAIDCIHCCSPFWTPLAFASD
jgi:hypothetical protein